MYVKVLFWAGAIELTHCVNDIILVQFWCRSKTEQDMAMSDFDLFGDLVTLTFDFEN